MSQQLKCLLHKHENLSLDLWHPHKTQLLSLNACNLSPGEVETGALRHHPHKHTHTHMHTSTYTHTHTHAHTQTCTYTHSHNTHAHIHTYIHSQAPQEPHASIPCNIPGRHRRSRVSPCQLAGQRLPKPILPLASCFCSPDSSSAASRTICWIRPFFDLGTWKL